MWDASDLWYLFKLAIKTATGVVIFGVLGWAFYTTPPGIPKPPKTEAELRERAESILWTPKLTGDDGHRQDILEPFVEDGQEFRRIWGPWERAADAASWTAYDKRHVGRGGGAVAWLDDMRQRSRALCDALDEEWIEKEREERKRSLSVDEGIYLWRLRGQLSECRYWQRQAEQAQAAAQ